LQSFQARNVQSQESVEQLNLPDSEETRHLTLTSNQLSKSEIGSELLLSLYCLFGVAVVIIPSQSLSLKENLAKIMLEAIANLTAAFDRCDHRRQRRLVAQIQKITHSLDDYYKRKLLGEFAHY